MRLKRKIITALMTVLMLSSISVNAMAANVNYKFRLSNTDTSYNVYTDESNVKSYVNENATVSATFNTAPGWGYAFCLKHRTSLTTYITDTVTSPGQWISGTGTIHPAYLSGHNVVGRAYYVAARIDNDYYGTYYVEGKFNSDYTNP